MKSWKNKCKEKSNFLSLEKEDVLIPTSLTSTKKFETNLTNKSQEKEFKTSKKEEV